MYLIVFLMPLLILNALNINETAHKMREILNKYKIYKHKRCLDYSKFLKFENFAEKTLKMFENTERYVEYLKHYNLSDCDYYHSYDSVSVCKRQHAIHGFIIHDKVSDSSWKEYKTAYKKLYFNTPHEVSALKVWRNNLKRVAEHNRQYLAGKTSYSLHLNHFGDWSIPAYIKQLLKLIHTIPLFDPAKDHAKTAYHESLHRKIPNKVDWRSKGFKPRREEQFHCGACYAFTVAHALQAQLYKKHGDWSELSPQQIVDCSFKDGNFGCDGGSLQAAMRYAARDGLMKESYYPYIGKKGECHHNSVSLRTKARRWATLPAKDEDAIERALATIGPLAVGVNASPFTFQLYRNGIYDDPFCAPWGLNHAMLLVGYTPEYWILLNWWGKQWGEDGYMRIRRGFNVCGVANMATYVEL